MSNNKYWKLIRNDQHDDNNFDTMSFDAPQRSLNQIEKQTFLDAISRPLIIFPFTDLEQNRTRYMYFDRNRANLVSIIDRDGSTGNIFRVVGYMFSFTTPRLPNFETTEMSRTVIDDTIQSANIEEDKVWILIRTDTDIAATYIEDLQIERMYFGAVQAAHPIESTAFRTAIQNNGLDISFINTDNTTAFTRYDPIIDLPTVGKHVIPYYIKFQTRELPDNYENRRLMGYLCNQRNILETIKGSKIFPNEVDWPDDIVADVTFSLDMDGTIPLACFIRQTESDGESPSNALPEVESDALSEFESDAEPSSAASSTDNSLSNSIVDDGSSGWGSDGGKKQTKKRNKTRNTKRQKHRQNDKNKSRRRQS
jgi:hypothetical protein